jgi:hydrogenase maturation protease
VPATVLVIGYGNTLRGDDGIGPAVAEDVAALFLPGVRVIVVHQLAPELAADLADVRLAVFVDAAVSGAPFASERIEPGANSAVMTHTADPHGLLAICTTVYGRCPEAWLVTAGGADFDFRDGLSPIGRENAREALGYVTNLIRVCLRGEGTDGGGQLGRTQVEGESPDRRHR